MRRALSALRRALVPFGLGLFAAVGCYKSATGPDPDDKNFYFPVGVAFDALDPAQPDAKHKFLFVANSNFDLQFNGGTVQALDLDAIDRDARRCASPDLEAKPECATIVARSSRTAPVSTYVRSSVRIGAFAADLRVVPRRDASGKLLPNAGRVLVPVRGDASLTAIDFDVAGNDITLRCAPGAAPNKTGARCSTPWRMGTDAAKSSRGLVLEGEPFAIATAPAPVVPKAHPDDPKEPSATGLATVIHQSTGDVSLFVDTERDSAANPPSIQLAHAITGLPGGATAIARLDVPGMSTVRFLVTNRTQASVFTVDYFPDPQVGRGGLVISGAIPLPVQNQGYDSRGIVVDPPNPGETRGTRVFLTNRTPSAIVSGEVDPSGNLTFFENFPLPVGPSRITRASIGGKSWIFAAAFDARSVVIFDPDTRRIANVVRTHRGPYAISVDETRKLGIITNFTDSTLQVIELDPAAPADQYQTIIYSVGVPSGPTS